MAIKVGANLFLVRSIQAIVIYALLAVSEFRAVQAQQEEISTPLVKIGFLFNFARFASWPSQFLGETNSEVRLCLLQDHSLGEDIFKLSNRVVDSGKLKVILLSREEVVRDLEKKVLPEKRCAILFISEETPKDEGQKVDKALKGAPTLVITEDLNLGTIRLYVEERKLHFAVSMPRLKESGVRLGSQVLGLAKLVND